MKEKILTLIIGILIGAILATAGFIVYDNVNDKKEDNTTNTSTSEEFNGGKGQRPGNFGNDGNMPNFEDGEIPEMPNGEMPEMPNGEMPDGEEPPAKPDGEDNSTVNMTQEGNRPNNTTSNSNNTSGDA